MNCSRWFAGYGFLVAMLAASPVVAQVADYDADGVPNVVDNCTILWNPTQLDTDCDGYGDRCDADYDNDGVVTLLDYAIFNLGPVTNILFDFARPFDGVANAADDAAVLAALGSAPGPSAGVPPGAPSCAPSTLTGPRYCIIPGSVGNGTAYAWRLSGGGLGGPEVEDPVAPTLAGLGSLHLMLDFQSSIEETFWLYIPHPPPLIVTGISFSPDCFYLSDPLVTLSVGPAGNPTACVVTGAGCAFNPVIYLAGPVVPALPWGATAGLAALLCGTGFFLMRRRSAMQD